MGISLSHAQVLVKGRIYDSTKINPVEGVEALTNTGSRTVTDSLGQFRMWVSEKDSFYFVFRNKATKKFTLKEIGDPEKFELSLHVRLYNKYSTLKEVIVWGRSYRQDSIENRENYKSIFGYTKPGVKPTISADGVAGADLKELVNMFRFKRNRALRAFRSRLETQEKEKYVNYRFNKTLVRRITRMDGPMLDSFMVLYRPEYEFLVLADEISFTEYILESFYEYRISQIKPDANK